MERIDDIVDRALAYTEVVLAETPQYADVALAKLSRIREMLRSSCPNNHNVERLCRYIAECKERLGRNKRH